MVIAVLPFVDKVWGVGVVGLQDRQLVVYSSSRLLNRSRQDFESKLDGPSG